MNYKLQKSGLSFSLSEKNYIAEGGEGKIYAKDDTAYKICFPGKMIPVGKIKELSVLQKDFILAPQDIILENKTPIGYTMRFIPQNDCFCLTSVMNNTFWGRENVTTDKMLKLVKFMEEGIEYIHSNKILLVDLNEFNFLAEKGLTKVFFIDTNSYQTPSYPASAIMDCIKDRQSSKFSELSDWFSFAILSFNMLIGIHPFRAGNHPNIQGSIDEKMDLRMRKNISVLNSQVKFPKNASRPFSTLPSAYLDWYTQIFEKGKRLPPPTNFVAVIPLQPKDISVVSDVLNVRNIFSANEKIQHIEYIEGKRIVVTASSVYIDERKIDNKLPTKNLFLFNNELYAIDNKAVYNLNRQTEEIKKKFDNVTKIGHFIYAQLSDKIFNIELKKIAGKNILEQREVANVMPLSTFFGYSSIIQNVSGTNYIVSLREGKQCSQYRIKELDRHKILSCKQTDNLVFIFSKDNNNKIVSTKIVLDGNSYVIKEQKTCDYFEYQNCLLDNGILVETNYDGNLVISKHDSFKELKDAFTESESFLLTNNGSTVILVKNNQVFEVSMRK